MCTKSVRSVLNRPWVVAGSHERLDVTCYPTSNAWNRGMTPYVGPALIEKSTAASSRSVPSAMPRRTQAPPPPPPAGYGAPLLLVQLAMALLSPGVGAPPPSSVSLSLEPRPPSSNFFLTKSNGGPCT